MNLCDVCGAQVVHPRRKRCSDECADYARRITGLAKALKRVGKCLYCDQPNSGQGRRTCRDHHEHQRDASKRNAREGNRQRYVTSMEGKTRRRRTVDCPDGHKWCARCQAFLPLAAFSSVSGKINSYCRPCWKSYLHEAGIRRRFGISYPQYFGLLAAQGGSCAVCECKPRGQQLAVDHDHATGLIRGLLCKNCNQTLGAVRDSVDRLMRYVNYLDAPPAAAHGWKVPE